MKAKALAILNADWTDQFAYAKGDQELWTVKLVKDALVDAFRMLRHSARVGPRGMKAAWPEYALDMADFNEQSIAGTLRQQQAPRPAYRTRMNVTRMEMVLLGWKDEDGNDHAAWLLGPLQDTDLREKLEACVFAELRGEATTDLVLRMGWSLATFKRHRDRAAGIIAHRLNVIGIEPWSS